MTPIRRPLGATVLIFAAGVLSTLAQQPAADAPLGASDVFRMAAPSVVVVLRQGGDGAVQGQGSGVVVGDGRVITNRHVVEGAARLRVHQAGKAGPARLSYLDRERDLALLEVDWLHAPAATRRASDTLEIGERVYAVGAPQSLDLSLSDGLVSGLKPRSGGQIVQTTAPISRGSSGGGLFDAQGRLVGITAFALRDAQNMNYALPVEWVATIESFAAQAAPATDAAASGGDPGPARILAVREEPGEQAHLVVEADRPLGYDYASQSTSEAVLNVFGAAADLPEQMPVRASAFDSVRISSGELAGKAVVTISVRLKAPAAHRVYSEGNALHLVFQ